MLWKGLSYCISCGELLLCADDSTTTLGSVECSFSSDDGLTLSGSAADLAPDLGNCVPVGRHVWYTRMTYLRGWE